MTQMDKENLRLKIQQELDKVKEDIVHLEDLTQPIAPENAIGRVSRMDAINNKSINEASLQQARTKLIGLEKALQNVDKKDFGICVKCHKPIPVGRIMLMPHVVKCVNCS